MNKLGQNPFLTQENIQVNFKDAEKILADLAQKFQANTPSANTLNAAAATGAVNRPNNVLNSENNITQSGVNFGAVLSGQASETGQNSTTVPFSRDTFLIYLQNRLGGQRFTQRYKIVENKLYVTFRTLKSWESEFCANVVQKQLASDPINNPNYLALQARTMLSLDSVEVNSDTHNVGEQIDALMKAYQESAVSKPSVTFKEIRDLIWGIGPLQDEAVWKNVCLAYNDFRKLVNAMDQEERSPNFFKQTEL